MATSAEGVSCEREAQGRAQQGENCGWWRQTLNPNLKSNPIQALMKR